MMQRACALALLNNGVTILRNPGYSNDDKTAIEIIKNIGAQVLENENSISIISNGKINPVQIINCGESGLSLRMFAPIIALSDSEITLIGEGTLLNRPLHLLNNIFSSLNVFAASNNGFLPLQIKGPMMPADIDVDGSKSSQYLTGLLFAFASIAEKSITISVDNLVSKPYIDLSLEMLRLFGYSVSHDNYKQFFISPVKVKNNDYTIDIEADWSSAAFLLVAGAIAGNVTVCGLQLNSCQADKAIVEVLESCGANINFENNAVSVNKQNSLSSFIFDATDCPDLFPALVVLAINCKGISIINGVHRLADKESNRAHAIVSEFGKMGADIVIENDFMKINGNVKLNTATIWSHNDHRIAMAASIAALNIEEGILINNAEAVNKSFPEFYNSLKILGASLSLTNE
jgi:3-phosphoshikimate 1-carboxyvinyltransferase